MLISCVIPTYKSEDKLIKLLDSIERSTLTIHEIVIVDDDPHSKINLPNVSLKLKYHKNNSNQGPSFSRNIGLRLTEGDVVIFLDSDIILRKNCLELLIEPIVKNELDVTTGTYSNFSIGDNFFTNYKSCYMNFIHSRLEGVKVNFVLGAVCAIRRNDFIPWPENKRFAEDTWWGHDLVYKNNKSVGIVLDAKVDHLKSYNLIKHVENDFKIASGFVDSFVDFYSFRKGHDFSHVGHHQMISVVLAPLILLLLFINPVCSFLGLLCWVYFSRELTSYLVKRLNTTFVYPYYYINCIIFAFGILFGLLKKLSKRSQ